MGIDSINKGHYERPDQVREYSEEDTLWPEEQLILEKYEAHIRDRTVLDIGCGGGRTARFLGRLTNDYTGIDYSQGMVDACQKNFSTLKFHHCDASDMRIFDDESFDFVFFAFNGIDCMSHEKRIKSLAETYRVLKQNGVFAFSTHNLDDRRLVTAFDIRDINIVNNIRNILSYLKVRKHQIRTETHAILSDPLGGFGCLVYYIRKRDQVKQLENVDFKDIVILNQKVQFVGADSLDRDSQFIHYVCRKPL